jgi:hypothetical protein
MILAVRNLISEEEKKGLFVVSHAAVQFRSKKKLRIMLS